MQPTKPLRTNRLVRSITTDQYDPPFSPAEHIYQDIDSSYEADVDRVPPPLPPRSPRPRLLPPPPSPQPRHERRLPHQTSAPGLRNPAPVYEERMVPPPPPPKPYMYASLPNLAAGSSLCRPQTYTPKTLLADELPRPDITTGGPRRPAPPRPPPPVKRPPPNSSPFSTYASPSFFPSSSSSSSSLYSSSGYGTEPLYEEVEEHVYLDLMPDRSRRYTYLDHLLDEWKKVDVCDNMSPSLYGVGRDDQTRDVNQKAITLTRALHHFKSLLDALQQHVSELTTFCDDLDKKQKKNKAMGIAGGTTGAVGGVATVVGVVLAPVTMGLSLVVTAIGAGMVATAGGIGAHAAIADRKNMADKTTMEGIVHDYANDVVDMERCSLLIRDGMDELRRYDYNELWGPGVLPEAQRITELSQLMLEKDTLSASGMSTASKGRISSVNLLQAFSRELDLYFTEKNGQKLKKSNEMKFACRVRQLVENLQEVLDELNLIWEQFSN